MTKKNTEEVVKKTHDIWLYIAPVMASITIIAYILSDAYLSSERLMGEDKIGHYATIVAWMILLTVVAFVLAFARSRGRKRIIAALLTAVCSIWGYSVVLIGALSH